MNHPPRGVQNSRANRLENPRHARPGDIQRLFRCDRVLRRDGPELVAGADRTEAISRPAGPAGEGRPDALSLRHPVRRDDGQPGAGRGDGAGDRRNHFAAGACVFTFSAHVLRDLLSGQLRHRHVTAHRHGRAGAQELGDPQRHAAAAVFRRAVDSFHLHVLSVHLAADGGDARRAAAGGNQTFRQGRRAAHRRRAPLAPGRIDRAGRDPPKPRSESWPARFNLPISKSARS